MQPFDPSQIDPVAHACAVHRSSGMPDRLHPGYNAPYAPNEIDKTIHSICVGIFQLFCCGCS